MYGTVKRYVGALLILCWATIALNGTVLAQEPPVDPDVDALVKALTPAIERILAPEQSTNHAIDVGAIVTALGGVLVFAWRVAPRLGRDPDLAAELATIKTLLQAHHTEAEKELKALREDVDTVAKKLHDLKGTAAHLETVEEVQKVLHEVTQRLLILEHRSKIRP